MGNDPTRRALLRATGAGAAAASLGSVAPIADARAAAQESATEIETAGDLQAIEDDLGGSYVLVDDVDASGVDFDPLGSEAEPFTGTLDGDGHAVSGLAIEDRSGEPTGLFRAVGSRDVEAGGFVENVELADVDVRGERRVGAVVGVNRGSVTGVTVGGVVTGTEDVGGVVGGNGGCLDGLTATCDVTGEANVGGLVGDHADLLTSSSAAGNVAGANAVGGLVGNVRRGAVTRSTATGDVTGTGEISTLIGGLVGALGGRVGDCTAEGSVTGSEQVGSLVGYNTGVVLTSTSPGSGGPLVGEDAGEVVPSDHASLGGSERVAWWHQTYTGDRVSASPTIVDGTVYVGTFPGIGGCKPNVYALDAATGERDWLLDTEANGQRTAGSHRRLSYVKTAAANVVGDTAYVTVPDRGLLLAIGTETGEEQWRVDMEWASHPGSPTRYGDTVFVMDGEWLYWFDAETGERVRRRAIKDPGVSLSVGDGRVYAFDQDDRLRAIEVRSGDTAWTFDGVETAIRHAAPTMAGGTVYAVGREGVLHAVDATTGDPEWEYEMRLDGSVDPPRTMPTVANGTVFLGARSGRVYAADAATGEEAWTYMTERGHTVHAAPTVVDDTVFVGSDDAHLYALDAASGEENWRFEARGGVRSAPVVVDGVVYVGTTNGFVYALDADVEGSSEDSRVAQGTLGHHDAWASQDGGPAVVQSTDTATAATETEGSGGSDTPATAGSDGGAGGSATTVAAGETDERGSTATDASGPGPGVAGALASALGAGYLLNWRGDRNASTARDPDADRGRE